MPGGWEETRWKYRDPVVASEYDRRRYARPERRLREVLHQLTLARALRVVPAGSSVLDVPCGTGRLLDWLRGRGYRVTGADIAPAMLAVAQARTSTPLLVAEAEALPFEDASWDAILAARFVHLIPPHARPRVLRELARVARSWVLLTVPLEEGTLKSAWRAVRGRSKPRRLERSALVGELERAGLQVVRVVAKLPRLSTFHVLVCRVQ